MAAGRTLKVNPQTVALAEDAAAVVSSVSAAVATPPLDPCLSLLLPQSASLVEASAWQSCSSGAMQRT